MKTKIKCPFCGYEWETSSKLKYVSCPSCLKKVLNPNGKRNKKGELNGKRKR